MTDNLPLEALVLAHSPTDAPDAVLARARSYLAFLTQAGDEPALLAEAVALDAAKAEAGASLPSATAMPGDPTVVTRSVG